MQQTWAPKEGVTLEDINKDCQANFEKIVDRAMQLGINHFETARGSFKPSKICDIFF